IVDYYMCTMGEVMNAALPSGLKLSSETKIIQNTEYRIQNTELTDDEFLICEALKKNEVLTMSEAEEIIQGKSAHAVVKSLIEKNSVLIYEELKEKFKPKIVPFVRFTSFANDEKNLEEIYTILEEKKQNQLDLVIAYIKLSERHSKKRKEVKKSELLEAAGAKESTLKSLTGKNIFEIYNKDIGRFAEEDISASSKTLSPEQIEALKKIKKEWETKEVVLLHGVTSSGKTEIYIKLIEETLKEGKQVLYLLPEIALTTHIVSRIKKYFGDALGVYHSRFNENERVEIWNEVVQFKIQNSKFKIILGARSALFLPFSNLGLVIVDEEHDSSYKQYDPAPRYEARDTAIVLANIHNKAPLNTGDASSQIPPLGGEGAKVLLGSATPSIESYYNAQIGKYGFAELNTRHGGVQMPEILIADIKDATKRKKMKSHFSPLLCESIQNALDKKEQVILFQNRRGFAPYLECDACGWTPQCRNCDVSLVYHKASSVLRCHYCGYSVPLPSACLACGDTNMQMKNFGTEKIEEELQIFFPDARVARMDLDSTRSKHSFQLLLSDFEERNIDILVGTQMVTKGLDFDNVSTVGILSAEYMMNFPDFRSHERSFQMMAQVSGRAGRKEKQGKVVIQTYEPKHHIIQQVMQNDFKSMYTQEIEHRKIFQYPPFHRLIELTIIDQDIDKVNSSAYELGNKLKNVFGKRILGPEFPLIQRIKNRHHKKIVIKIARDESASKVKEKIHALIAEIHNYPAYRYLKVQADVDPA
ncbi:MAG: primosomal protein N', partial [Bacteroidota bacterium]